MTNLYWPVYKNLEKEVLELSYSVYFDDNQIEYTANKKDEKNGEIQYIKTPTYSLKIGNLLVRCCTEIEALIQELTKGKDEEVKKTPSVDSTRPITTGCRLKYLHHAWSLNKKIVFVSCSNMFFQNEDNKSFAPFSYQNNDDNDYYSAYNAIKHNRSVQTIHKGNIRFLLRALAALYLLNIYYKDTSINAGDGYLSIVQNGRYEGSVIDTPVFAVGSDLFTVSSFSPPMPWFPPKETYVAVENEHVYCKKITDISYLTSMTALFKKRKELNSEYPNDDFDNNGSDAYKKLHEYGFQVFSIQSSYEFVVNKGQVIYCEVDELFLQ